MNGIDGMNGVDGENGGERMPRPLSPASDAARDAIADPGPPGAAPPAAPVVEPPSPEIALAQDASPLPGAHRGGFQRLPTAPVDVTVQRAPAEPGTDPDLDSATVPTPWASVESGVLPRGLAGWALGFAVVGLGVSLVVGWGFPIGIVAIVTAILALRRPLESRAVAIWALVLGAVSILYSAGWLVYAASRADLIG